MSKTSFLNRLRTAITRPFNPREVQGAVHVKEKMFGSVSQGGAAYINNITHCIGIHGTSASQEHFLLHKYFENTEDDLVQVLDELEITNATLFMHLDTARQSGNYGSSALAYSQQNREDVMEAFKRLGIKAKNIEFVNISGVLLVENNGIISYEQNFTPINPVLAEGIIPVSYYKDRKTDATGSILITEGTLKNERPSVSYVQRYAEEKAKVTLEEEIKL